MCDDKLLIGIEIPIISTVSFSETDILDIALIGVFTNTVFIVVRIRRLLTFSENISQKQKAQSKKQREGSFFKITGKCSMKLKHDDN